MDNVQVVVTGEQWIGYGASSFSSVIGEMMDSAERELVMTVYVISDFKVIENIERSLNRGVSTEIFIYENPDQDHSFFDHIISLERRYAHCGVHIIKNNVLHAKVLVADARRVLVGSANPTFHGMVRNYEMGLLMDDGNVAQSVLTLLWRLNKK